LIEKTLRACERGRKVKEGTAAFSPIQFSNPSIFPTGGNAARKENLQQAGGLAKIFATVSYLKALLRCKI
jgi:hypothetical protein